MIIDELLLLKLTKAEARNLFELIHKRRKKCSTIFCSQFRESEWYPQNCGVESTLADAIIDRISYDSYKIDIESIEPTKVLSVGEVYGLKPAQSKQEGSFRWETSTIIPCCSSSFTTCFPNLVNLP